MNADLPSNNPGTSAQSTSAVVDLSPQPVFIGIDLAWSPRNPSGGAVIAGNTLTTCTGDLGDDDDIEAFVAGALHTGTPAVVAIDAPLRVPNLSGSRACDKELSAEWRRFEAGALPANRRLLAHDGVVRGEALVARLAAHGFVEAAPVPHRTPERVVCEVFPHPAHVALFGLTRTFKYKTRQGRTLAARHAEFHRYQQALAALGHGDPPLDLQQHNLLNIDVTQLRGRALKRYEDQLDAVTCAYVAAYVWAHGPARQRVYGDLPSGHIIVPARAR